MGVDMPCFLSFPSAKDPLYDSRCPGKSTAVVLAESRVEFFGTPGPMGKRGDAYDKVKESYKELLLNAFHISSRRLLTSILAHHGLTNIIWAILALMVSI